MATITSAPGSVSIPNAHLRHGGEVFSADDHYAAKQRLLAMPGSISPILHGDHRLGSIDITINNTNGVQRPLSSLLTEASGTITPILLAKHHLPSILLQHGPLAIRHITAHLIQTLPGFSSIPPARQRRLVVGSLEGRGGSTGSQGEVGGLDGDVCFEKVGWGRWDARKKGDPARERTVATNSTYTASNKLLSAEMHPSHSYAGESGIFVQSEEEVSHDEDVDMDAGDQMSLDETSTDSSEDDDMTDEEDWAQMGAAMLRRHGGSPITSDGWSNSFNRSPGGWKTAQPFSTENAVEKRAREEREAVEALVKLSSV
ncbi:putative Sin3 binding protein-domain-containing protein [Geopyxis carbonaria]|nr:putative Sin3 binding protein-domain-containing protein [Geopyxis carbonaria]